MLGNVRLWGCVNPFMLPRPSCGTCLGFDILPIWNLIPDGEALFDLEPEELAGPLLQDLNTDQSGQLNRYNYTLPHAFGDYPREWQCAVSEAITKAWVWLEREGLLAPKPGTQGAWVFITRRGRKLATAEQVAAYRRSKLLPKQLLPPRILQKVWTSFLRGDYDTAVLQAMKEVEVAVREAGRFDSTEPGVNLKRKAFDAGRGPLRDSDPATPPPEREAAAQ
jgi:hypothetical protein